jgi:hypothetical protein
MFKQVVQTFINFDYNNMMLWKLCLFKVYIMFHILTYILKPWLLILQYSLIRFDNKLSNN